MKEEGEDGSVFIEVCLLLCVCVYYCVCVFITAVPITKLFAWGGGGTIEDLCYERLRVEACVD